MNVYKHVQIAYPMLVLTVAVTVFFLWIQSTARAEPPSVDSGTNVVVTAIMALVILVLASYITLTVSIDTDHLRVTFGFGIFRKKFSLADVSSVRVVRNPWYYGWGIRLWLWPTMWLYTVSGFDAVELIMKNGKVYRIGTDVPEELSNVIRTAAHLD